jgi:hypothetical protein
MLVANILFLAEGEIEHAVADAQSMQPYLAQNVPRTNFFTERADKAPARGSNSDSDALNRWVL